MDEVYWKRQDGSIQNKSDIEVLFERINKLEKEFTNHVNYFGDWRSDRLHCDREVENNFYNHYARIDDLEKIRAGTRLLKLEQYMEMEDRVTCCEVLNRLTVLEFNVDKMRFPEKRPHKCPVCDGHGMIPLKEPIKETKDNRDATIFSISCVPCNAKGIVWG